VRSLAGLAVAALLLTGCGSVPAFNPGVAARVADSSISNNEVEDVAAAVAYLLSAGARNITGTVITVDAGNTA